MCVLKLLRDQVLKGTSARQLLFALLLDNEELLAFFRQGENVGGGEAQWEGLVCGWNTAVLEGD